MLDGHEIRHLDLHRNTRVPESFERDTELRLGDRIDVQLAEVEPVGARLRTILLARYACCSFLGGAVRLRVPCTRDPNVWRPPSAMAQTSINAPRTLNLEIVMA